MSTESTRRAIPGAILEPLEQLMFGAIGMTSFALSEASATDLTLPQWRALVVIGRTDAIRVGDVASRIGVALPSTSRLIQRLERRGLVTTARDESDRRATLVRMTEHGRSVRSEVIDRRRGRMEAAVAAHAEELPSDLIGGLTVLARAFDRYE